jgi:chemotaxis protein methyltransferase CheR
MGESRDVFPFLRDLIYRHSGIHLTEKDRGVLSTRMGRRLQALSMRDTGEYLRFLQGGEGADEIPSLLDAVTINYTFFFRESQHFQYLTTEVLRRVVPARARDGGRRVRGWSAGCSSGEEPYSIAMTFAEAAGDLDRWDFRLLATDINRRVLRVGARGVYPLSRLTGVPGEYRYKYLVRDGDTPAECLRITEELRRAASFRRLNILEPISSMAGLFDFIFCRNVMIYFDDPTKERLVRNFHRCLAPGGYLFVGASESLSGIPHSFDSAAPSIYHKG